MIYLRMMIYTLAAGAAALGMGYFDPEAMTFTIDLENLVLALSAGGVLNVAVLQLFGKK